MEQDYAVIVGGKIINVVVWDGVTPWAAPEGATVMLRSEALAAGVPYGPPMVDG